MEPAWQAGSSDPRFLGWSACVFCTGQEATPMGWRAPRGSNNIYHLHSPRPYSTASSIFKNNATKSTHRHEAWTRIQRVARFGKQSQITSHRTGHPRNPFEYGMQKEKAVPACERGNSFEVKKKKGQRSNRMIGCTHPLARASVR